MTPHELFQVKVTVIYSFHHIVSVSKQIGTSSFFNLTHESLTTSSHVICIFVHVDLQQNLLHLGS
jgi:hypothetical protein